MSTAKKHTKTHSTYAFESNTNSVAASQMRNALNKLADSIGSEHGDDARTRFENELDSFFTLFRRYLVEKSSSNTLEWDKITDSRHLNQKTCCKEMTKMLRRDKDLC